jgi:hypothetical protein
MSDGVSPSPLLQRPQDERPYAEHDVACENAVWFSRCIKGDTEGIKGLVPMSLNTTPMLPSVSAQNVCGERASTSAPLAAGSSVWTCGNQ